MTERGEIAQTGSLGIQQDQIVGAILLHPNDDLLSIGRKAGSESPHPAGELLFLVFLEIVAEQVTEMGAIFAPFDATIIERLAVAAPGDLAVCLGFDQVKEQARCAAVYGRPPQLSGHRR